MSESDRDLAARFRSLAESDRDQAPAFQGRRAASPRRPSSLPAALAVAAGLVLALVVVSRHGDDATSVAIARAEALSAWSAPTDAFLAPVDDSISGITPSLTLSSVTLPETRSTP